MPANILKAAALLAILSSGSAFAIQITTGNPNNQGTDNVLFNDGSLQHTGTLVQGNFSGANSAFVVDFSSTSGTGQLVGNGGQARVEGGTGNSPYSNLSFALENGATFTKAILNAISDANANGTISFSIDYIDGANSPFTQQFTFDKNGNNFFGIQAEGSEKITKVTFDTDVGVQDTRQIRIGGFAVPDGGATLLLAGLSLACLGAIRSKLR